MAGCSDLPQRELCGDFGAAYTVSEMVTSDTQLWHTRKSNFRLQWGTTLGPKIVQIAGADPQMLAEAARRAEDFGAEVIDINMGCPAKKVCAKAAGSALLRDEPLVQAILESVVNATKAPVTLKIRTGWGPDTKNAATIADIAEGSGIQALTVHGRTRACRFNGAAEYDTIAEVVRRVAIPVIANGDITDAKKAEAVLRHTGAAAVMVGRAAQGNPWIFQQINHYLATGQILAPPTTGEIFVTLNRHLAAVHSFYGDFLGVRIARKVLGWYLNRHFQTINGELTAATRQSFNRLSSLQEQLTAVQDFRERLQQPEDQAA